MRRSPVASLILIVLVAGCATTRPEIRRQRVERVLSTLASDEMRGRQTFAPEADRAAAFIAGEFEAIGLEPMPGADQFLQRFPIYSVTVSDLAVTLNGVDISTERIAATLSDTSIGWTEADGPPVTVVGADGNVMQAFQSARRSGNALVVVHSSHQAIFERLRGFVSRPSRTTEPGGGSNLVMVLSDEIAETYVVTGASLRSETLLANVVGMIPGRRADELVLFSGHYDHIGVVRPVEGDSIANGANDDASGVTAVVELARRFQADRKPERTIVFAAFTGEEVGGYGSRHFATTVNPEQIVAMFNIEMIGKGAVEGPNTAWITGWGRSDFGPILQRAVEGTEYQFYPDPYPDQNLFFRSDNATLARLGVPAHSISTTPIDVDEDYHQVSDEVATLDLDHLTATIQAIARGAATIISGQETPTRIDPESVVR